MNPTTNHLNHQQICDLLLALPLSPEQADHDLAGDYLPATLGDADLDAGREHLHHCLICTAELDLLRSSVAGFQAASNALADRELARRPLRPPFASLRSSTPSRGFAAPGLFWATAALLVAAVLPLGLRHNFNPILAPKTGVPASPVSTAATASASTSESDEALLEDINQDLSVAVPSALQPLEGPTGKPAQTTSSSSQGNN